MIGLLAHDGAMTRSRAVRRADLSAVSGQRRSLATGRVGTGRRRGWLACAIALTTWMGAVVGLAPSAAAATGGVLSGDVEAFSTGSIGICAVECVNEYGMVGWEMEAPDFYETKVKNKPGLWRTAEAVEAGSYKIYFRGSVVVRADSRRGYLKAVEGGYEIVDGFDDGDWFDVAEGTDLDLGVMDLVMDPEKTAGADIRPSLSSFGPNASNKIRMIKVGEGAVMIIRSSGCGRVQLVKRSRRTGTYTYRWNDPDASEHYGRKLTLRVFVRFPDGSQFPLATSTYDTSSFGWRC